MSKYHDDDTVASHPGQVALSEARLRELEPELFDDRTFKCGPGCLIDHPAQAMRERIAEHLELGDTQPALVVSTDPLVVAAYSEDVDAATLLRFPLELVGRYGLSPGSRLVSVNTYSDIRNTRTGNILYAVDLVPGPRRIAWSNVEPYIADFLTDDTERLDAHRQHFPEAVWQRLAEVTDVRIRQHGLHTARPGKPTLAGTPVLINGARDHFRALSEKPWPRHVRWILLGAVAILVAHLLSTMWR